MPFVLHLQTRDLVESLRIENHAPPLYRVVVKTDVCLFVTEGT